MPTLKEGNLLFHFPGDEENVTQYDNWSFYRNQFSRIATQVKAVDFLFLDRGICWLIEVKDYRRHQRTKALDLADEIALKVKDTLAALAVARVNAKDIEEKQFALKVMKTKTFRIVLHLEQPRIPNRLFPRSVDESKVLIKLRQKLKSVDPRLLILNQSSSHSDVKWEVSLSS